MDEKEQVDTVLRLLAGKKLPKDSPPFVGAINWMKYLQTGGDEARRAKLMFAIRDTFEISEQEILEICKVSSGKVPTLIKRSTEAEFEALLPKGGWLEWYANYTRYTESPLSYHIFCSLAVLGSALGRRVYKPKGFFNIYPNYCVVLVGPPARVAKTSACEIAKKIIADCACCPIMADKVTPEVLAKRIKELGGHQLVFAPEFSVFFGKQKYMEGLTTFMLRALDSPDHMEIETIGRGLEELEGLALTVLGGSTMSLLANSSADQVTSSGFLSRVIMVIENDSEREFPQPRKGPEELGEKIRATVNRMKNYVGEVTYTPEADEWFNEWYHAFKARIRTITTDTHAETISRFGVHLERTAYLLHLAEHDNLHVCVECMKTAERLLKYVEARLPQAVQAIDKSAHAVGPDLIYETLRRLGGKSSHSDLLRRVSGKMNAPLFKLNMQTLLEERTVRESVEGVARYYTIEGERHGTT